MGGKDGCTLRPGAAARCDMYLFYQVNLISIRESQEKVREFVATMSTSSKEVFITDCDFDNHVVLKVHQERIKRKRLNPYTGFIPNLSLFLDLPNFPQECLPSA